MNSTKSSQNVSVLKIRPTAESWDPPITIFTDSGGSLRSAPRSHGPGPEKAAILAEKISDPPKYPQKDFTTNASFSVLVSGSVNPSTGTRELSPVRWCDREVDGVYLGKSGWVQVQQKSLDGTKEMLMDKNSGVSTLPARLNNSKCRCNPNERIEPSRPVYLPLLVEKRGLRVLPKTSSSFIEDLKSGSPPSITPIISPPPAFKDHRLEKPFPGKSLSLQRSKVVVDPETSKPPNDDWSSLKPGPTPTQQRFPRVLQAKSLDNDRFSNPTKNLSSFAFRSLDSNVSRENASNKRTFRRSETTCYDEGSDNSDDDDEDDDNSDCVDDDYDEDDDEICSKRYLKAKPVDGLNGQRPFRERNNQPNGRNDFVSVTNCSTRSSSMDSSSSSSSSSSGSCRRWNSKKSQEESEGSSKKHFRVKRSRSLQLSEKQSPNELLLVSQSSAWKSWDQTTCRPFPRSVKNQNSVQYPHLRQNPQEVASPVNGDSVPLASSRDHHLRHLNKMTRSEEQLLKEAQKEARIVSEFLNSTRSRTAARNLLIHRYFNRPENEVSVPGRGTPPETEYGVHFLGTDRRFQSKPQRHFELNYSNGSDSDFWQGNRVFHYSNSPKLLGSFIQETSEPPGQNVRNYSGLIKYDRREAGKSGFVSPESVDYSKSKKPPKADVFNRVLPKSGKPFFPNESLHYRNKQNGGRPRRESENSGFLQGTEREEESPPEGSSSVSSSSSSVWQTKAGRTLNGRTFSETVPSAVGRNGKALQETFYFRPRSAPTGENGGAKGVEQRSLSLPRSFLSERYGFKYSKQRLKQQCLETPTYGTLPGEWWVQPAVGSRTAPATPVRGLGDGRPEGTLAKNQQTRYSSSSTLLDDEAFFKSDWATQKTAPENYGGNVSNRRREVLSVRGVPSDPKTPAENSQENVLRKFRKKFSTRFSKAIRGSPKEEEDEAKEEMGEGRSDGKLLSPYLNGGVQGEDQKVRCDYMSPISTVDRRRDKKGFRHNKFDSRDSGIQMGSRGNMDSSESQDTDLHEDPESPREAGNREFGGKDKLWRPQNEVINQVLIDNLKADIQWRVMKKAQASGRNVRRTNSDLGGQRLLSWEAKNQQKMVASTPSPVRSRVGKLKDWNLSESGSFEKYHLRRSISQPVGLNEVPPLMRRTPSGTRYQALSEDERNQRVRNSEDELISDSEVSLSSFYDRKKSLDTDEECAVLADALWDHIAMEPCELPFRAGDVIKVLDTHDKDWWWGSTGEHSGYFPSAFVRLKVGQEDTVEDCLAAMSEGKQTAPQLLRGKSISLLSSDQVRSRVVRELLNTERDFVNILRDVIEGYMVECKRRTDMFTSGQIATIFSNIEDLLVFQNKFLKDLEESVDQEYPHKSCVGQIFLNHKSGFQMYSEYCNSHPMAIATLQELYQMNNYSKFFETCRLMRRLIEIPLDGYLLTPIQRICKYPLQLAELLKYTKPEHPDYEKVWEALTAMRDVATLINERKRKMESLEKLAAWQERVDGWEGEDLIDVSSRLIHHGDVVRITSGKSTSNVSLFLFDHQIIYCKKDLLKRNTYIYKGRISLDGSEVINVPDGKDIHQGVTVRHGLKICNCLEEKLLFFCCRSIEDKTKWLEALLEEKKLVAQDKDSGLDLPPTAKHLAKMAAKRTERSPPSKFKSKNKIPYEKLSSRPNRSSPKIKLGRRVGTWLNLGGVIRSPRTGLKTATSLQGVT